MSLRELKTHAISCDAPGCDEVFADCVELSAVTAISCARRKGWLITANGRDLCPACRLIVEPLTREEMIEEVQSRR